MLLVEDNAADIRLFEEAFLIQGIEREIVTVRDGAAALAYLDGAVRQDPSALPSLILLDLNLPRIDGREVLGRIKSDDRIAQIPVIVLTSSGSPEDIAGSYHDHANCFIRKPIAFDDFLEIAAGIASFWFGLVTLPEKST